MKILHTADWHIGEFKGPTENGVNLRAQDTMRCLDYMVDVARQELPDIVCVSGDIFHQEQIGPARYSKEMLNATRIITELSMVSKLVVVMRGTVNHDGNGQFKVLEKMFEKNPKVEVVTDPKVVSTPIADIACIPGFDKQEFRSKFPGLSSEEENIQWTQYISDMIMGLRAQCGNTNIVKDVVPVILMAHYTVPGCNMESGQTSFFANFEPVIPREALQVAGYDAVFLGHIHRPQVIEGLRNVYYAGAINAMNFNDEGQKRGFWIHEFKDGVYAGSTQFETPYREFVTVQFDETDIGKYIGMGNLYLREKGFPQKIADCIVRVKYSCTSYQKKSLNVPMLQSDLYDCGAFYVSDIEAENTIDVTNRGLLSEESDPLLNLKKWLDEKCFKDTDKIVELAEPIIAEAMKQSSIADIHGVFKPISIDVKNYRNYAKEHFDFADVSFCTINGVNGAGKSSLFMDAIVDCLFEDTREGDNKSWIRATEEARSGAIEFVFDIGINRFRVVRTRTKSGKPTLNLSQLSEDGTEWRNLSKERINETQNEINRVLGMDSMTFKSCALIMQDQYGLFLQARKDERIAILGNLLGLGIYGVMEVGARKQLADAKRELMSKKEAVKVKLEFIASKGNPTGELKNVEFLISDREKKLEEKNAEKEKISVEMALYTKAVEARDKLNKESGELSVQKDSLSAEIEETKRLISSCDIMLENSEKIRKNAEEYRSVSEEVTELAKDVLAYENEKRTLVDIMQQEQRYQNVVDNCKVRNDQITAEIAELSGDQEENIEMKLAELESLKNTAEEIAKRKLRVSEINGEILEIRSSHDAKVQELKLQLNTAKSNLSAYEQQKEIMDNSGCPDIKNASCRFLAKAVADSAKINDTVAGIKIYENAIAESEADIKALMDSKQKEINEVGYNPEEEKDLQKRISELEQYQNMKKQMEERKLRIARLEAEKESNDKTIAQSTENALQLKLRAQEVTKRVEELSESVSKHNAAIKRKSELEMYPEQERQLPVYEERKTNAENRLKILKKDYENVDEKLLAVTAELFTANEKVTQTNTNAENRLQDISLEVQRVTNSITELQISKGALQQKVEDVNKMQEEINGLKKEIENASELVTRYDILKQAFSQDGVPHQVIRNIIPHITDVANNILGSMTGGTMGIEFVMEKTVKGKDGDKATLDVLINEFGKTTLPYASKSGGEKVKASLAVILALAEIKTTAAGIQLGMLFIDEPPFLDEDGTQAYVDSLETIRRRYPDVKVMAITHDEAMKARFSQAVTVIKTEEGSKVVY